MNDIDLCFLNNENFENIENVIQVDKEICETIKVLNKKGYTTLASCAGHNNLSKYLRQECDIDLLEDLAKKEDYKHSIVVDKTDKSFGLVTPVSLTQIYILFDKEYKFISLPETFIYKNKVLESEIFYFDKDKKISSEELEKEIERRNNLLIKWANDLPINKERND